MCSVRTKAIAALLLIGLLSTGCATTGRPSPDIAAGRPLPYRQIFDLLDQAVDKHGVREASDFPVVGFPYLRTNRFLTALKDRVDEDSQQEWIESMRRLDLKARKKEIRNLPEQGVRELAESLADSPDRRVLWDRLAVASQKMLNHDRQQPGFLDALKASVGIDGEYSMAMRTFGLYPVAALPVTSATLKQYNVFRQWHQTPPDQLAIDGHLTIIGPIGHSTHSPQDVIGLFAPSRRNSLGVPDLTPDETRRLVLAYAPVIEQDVVGTFDLFGKLKWKKGHVDISVENPTVYYYITYSFFNGQPALQLNYAFWYTGRYGENSPRIEQGPLDGVTIRITFDREGEPAMADIMNNCGCYHFYAPRKDRVAGVNASSNGLYPFVPGWLPETFPRHRLAVRINSGWHQVQGLIAWEKADNLLAYELRPYDALEALPRPDGGHESVFTPDGILKDSSRIEPYVFFSMGIPKVGYMRQRGHHAIKLVGRGHFTDTDIYDLYFVFK